MCSQAETKMFTSNHRYTQKSSAQRAFVRAALKTETELSVTCVFKLLNTEAADLRTDLKMPFHTPHLSSQHQIHIYRSISHTSQHVNNLRVFYWPQTARWVTQNGFTNICRIWWRNKKETTAARMIPTEKWNIRRGTKVFCSLLFQLKHDFLETADTVKPLTAVIYMDGYLSCWTFSLWNLNKCRCYAKKI